MKLHPNVKDIAGQKFSRLTAVEYVKGSRWRCLCECGNTHETSTGHLMSGIVRSCGCLVRDTLVKRNSTHGHPRDRTYWSWSHMLQRCLNQSDKSYADYGGRGITVCDEWLRFEAFFADMGDKPPGLLLDRIDNSCGYYNGNCRWTTRIVQNNNKRNSLRYTHDGRTLSLNEWAAETGIDRETIWARIKNSGWAVDRALTTPARPRG